MKDFMSKYGHGLFALYLVIYLPWFFYMEGIETEYHVIHCFLDDYIPFNEIFIIPYGLWFFYMFFTCVYMFFRSERGEFYRLGITITVGMSLAMIIYALYPNCVDMRPEITRTNFLSKLVLLLHSVDTSANVCPSLHVFDTVAASVALWRNPYLRKKPWTQVINITLCILICISTVFLKQHSVIDMFWALVEYMFFYLLLYVPNWKYFQNKKVLLP